MTVRDAAGRLVSDLKSEDFVVLENGRPQRVQLFARAVEPGQEDALALDLGLLMDTSASMLQQLKLSQEAAVRFLESIPRARDLVTIFFDDDIRLSRYNSENQQGLFERIAEAKGGGDTALYDAISVYLSRVQDASGRKVLVLFTDGEDTRSALGPRRRPCELIRSSGVTIYPIAFTGGFAPGSTRALRSKSVLDQMAELTGGAVYTPALLQGPLRDLRQDPPGAAGPIRPRVRLGRPRARRQVQARQGRDRREGPPGASPRRLLRPLLDAPDVRAVVSFSALAKPRGWRWRARVLTCIRSVSVLPDLPSVALLLLLAACGSLGDHTRRRQPVAVPTPAPSPTSPRVVIFSIDGLRPDALLQAAPILSGSGHQRRLHLAGADDPAVHHAAVACLDAVRLRARPCTASPGTSTGRSGASSPCPPSSPPPARRDCGRSWWRARRSSGSSTCREWCRGSACCAGNDEEVATPRHRRGPGRVRPDVRAPAADGPHRPPERLDVAGLSRRRRGSGPRGRPASWRPCPRARRSS